MKFSVPKSVHFVGIGGIGMSALAEHMLRLGVRVSGSDRESNALTVNLQRQGATVFVGHNVRNVGDAQLVVRTSAVHADNCEVAFAESCGIPVLLREQLLGMVFDSFPVRIAVCGTHGKTTVTAWIHHVLQQCGVSHAAFIGGQYNGQNYFFGENIVVAEACEYNASFLNLHPTLCVCLNVEYDHPDCYANKQSVEAAFVKLFQQSETVLLSKKMQYVWPKGETYDDVQKTFTMENGCASFCLHSEDGLLPVQLSVCGEHNYGNALAVVAVAKKLHLPLSQVANAVGSFRGVERRWTMQNCKIPVVCDYAHHPTEILAAVATAKSVCNGRVVCVFQPHTYSRTKAFEKQFVSCFSNADEVVFLPVFAAREQPIEGVSSFNLFRLAQKCGYSAKCFESFAETAEYLLETVTNNDLVVLVGAGDVNRLAVLLV